MVDVPGRKLPPPPTRKVVAKAPVPPVPRRRTPVPPPGVAPGADAALFDFRTTDYTADSASRKPSSRERQVARSRAAARQATWEQRVRAWAAQALAEFRAIVSPYPDAQRQRKVWLTQVRRRQLIASLWDVTPPGKAVGTGKDKYLPAPEVAKTAACDRLVDEGTTLAGQYLAQVLARFTQGRRKGCRNWVTIPNETPADLVEVVQGELSPGQRAMLEASGFTIREEPILRRYKPGETRPGGALPRPPGQRPAPPRGRPVAPDKLPMTVQKALEVEVPFGKFRGEPLSELTLDNEGLSYLFWLYNEADIQSPRFAEAVEVVYNQYQDEAEEARHGSRR